MSQSTEVHRRVVRVGSHNNLMAMRKGIKCSLGFGDPRKGTELGWKGARKEREGQRMKGTGLEMATERRRDN